MLQSRPTRPRINHRRLFCPTSVYMSVTFAVLYLNLSSSLAYLIKSPSFQPKSALFEDLKNERNFQADDIPRRAVRLSESRYLPATGLFWSAADAPICRSIFERRSLRMRRNGLFSDESLERAVPPMLVPRAARYSGCSPTVPRACTGGRGFTIGE